MVEMVEIQIYQGGEVEDEVEDEDPDYQNQIMSLLDTNDVRMK